MKKYLLYMLLITCGGLFHCSETCDSGQLIGDLTVRVTINEGNPELFLTVFEGRIEKKDTLIAEWVTEERNVYALPANTYYSATVQYRDGIRDVLAINGTEMGTSTDDNSCETANNITLNLKLAK